MLAKINYSKLFKYSFFILGFFIFTSTINKVNACEIEFEILGDKKETYKAGDIIVLKIKVMFTHRVCTEHIKNTDIKTQGGKITGATKWKEISSGVWERKLKVKVLSNKEGKLTLNATRTCDKTGGFGSISINTKIAE